MFICFIVINVIELFFFKYKEKLNILYNLYEKSKILNKININNEKLNFKTIYCKDCNTKANPNQLYQQL